jgi:hypothetical protein
MEVQLNIETCEYGEPGSTPHVESRTETVHEGREVLFGSDRFHKKHALKVLMVTNISVGDCGAPRDRCDINLSQTS